MERCGPLAARCALSAKSVVLEIILSNRSVTVDSHGAGGGRNWADPITRHRNAGCCSERVAHFLRGLHDALWLCREHYVFARISSKCRCAKCERQHDTRASNRRTAQATKPVFYSHAVIVIPFRISRKLIQRLFKTKKRYFQYCESIRAQPEAAFRSGGIGLPAWAPRYLEAELHGMTKESEQLPAQDLSGLNESLKSKRQRRFQCRRLKSARTMRFAARAAS
jgi:hypothetical protein